jgi:four helix bundle protein
MAQASLAELGTQIEIAVRLNHLSPEQNEQFQALVATLRRQLYSLRNALSTPKGDRKNQL